jgi:hypothetical protein
MMPNTASTDDLFAVCVDHYAYSEPVAGVLSKVLFWSQFPQYRLRGRLGIFKTDAEIAKDVRKHPKTVGRLLRKVCAPAESGKSNAVFLTRYAPKPWHPSGRVRWLFRTELGDEIIDAAKALAKARLSRKSRKQNVATGRSELHRPAASKRSDRSPRYAATHIKQKHYTDSQTETLSSVEAERETESYEEKGFPEGIERFARLWKTACEECDRPRLAWRPSEVRRWSSELSTFIQEMGVAETPDEDVMARLRVLVRDFEWIKEQMGRAFRRYNTDALLIESFVRYSTKLWLAVEKRLAEKKFETSLPPKKSLSEYKI